MDCHRVESQFWMVESWPRICWKSSRIEECCKRLRNLFGKEFALCSLRPVPPKWSLSEGGTVVGTPVSGDYPLKRVKQF